MATAAGPFARRLPALVTGQPVDRPRDDGFGNGIAKAPSALTRIVQAQYRPLRIALVGKMMRDRLARRLPAALKHGAANSHARHRRHDVTCLEFTAEAVGNAHQIALVKRIEVTLPNDEPARLPHDPELRPVAAHQRRLLGYGQDHFFRRSIP